MRPSPDDTVCDPACGTGGFLLAVHDFILERHLQTNPDQKDRLKNNSLHGWEIVDSAARICAMNLYLRAYPKNSKLVRLGA